MKLKPNYKWRLFLCFFAIFSLFTISVVVLEKSRERKFKTDSLVARLDTYTDIVYEELYSGETFPSDTLFEHLLRLFPRNIRVSLIDNNGNVQNDNLIDSLSFMENHLQRPEIVQAAKVGQGTDMRVSASNQSRYLYFAKKYPQGYIRVALPYDVEVRNFLKSDNLFLYLIFILFLFVLFIINLATNRFALSIHRLRDFALDSSKGEGERSHFPHDELGQIGEQIAKNYIRMSRGKQRLELERQKLLQHIHSSNEGICFFSPSREVEFYNGLFIQYMSLLSDDAQISPQALFHNALFAPAVDFLSQRSRSFFEDVIKRQGKEFLLRINVFEDGSCEMILNDITEREKTRRLKQEMTGNIAHELRTPVTCIRGYLETMLDTPMEPEQQQRFMKQAYRQTLQLSELIQDIGLITKIEDAPALFALEEVDLNRLLENLKEDIATKLQDKRMTMQWDLPQQLSLNANPQLLYSIFRNLTDNAISYAGEGKAICIKLYDRDDEFCYFTFYDNGRGIQDESHLNRIFERFYRVNKGRTRDTGGSGLGLSIVKNAVLFHKGSIVAKNRAGGGLEFQFRLHV